MNISNIILKSIEWRYDQIKNLEDQAIRLFAGVSDGIEGVLIEQYGPFILCTIYNQDIAKYKKEILITLSKRFEYKSILLKVRSNNKENTFEYLNNEIYRKDSVLKCYEGSNQFEVHTDPRHDYGLYLDTKASRDFLASISNEKKVLNLFSYTCAFGIAAMKGGAESVTNIDPCKEYLEWGKRNSEYNNVQFKRYPDTTQDYLARHIRRLDSEKDTPYDITVVDPPAFLVGRGAKRLARNMWPEWMQHLKNGKCKEFIVIINDKSLGRQKNLDSFLKDGLGNDISIEVIDQSFDIIGQQLTTKDDKFYFNPIIFHVKAK